MMEERTPVYSENNGVELGYVVLDVQSGFWLAVDPAGTVLFDEAWTQREAVKELINATEPNDAFWLR